MSETDVVAPRRAWWLRSAGVSVRITESSHQRRLGDSALRSTRSGVEPFEQLHQQLVELVSFGVAQDAHRILVDLGERAGKCLGLVPALFGEGDR